MSLLYKCKYEQNRTKPLFLCAVLVACLGLAAIASQNSLNMFVL